MSNSKMHEYRVHHVTVGVVQSLPLGKFSGNYLGTSVGASVVCREQTANSQVCVMVPVAKPHMQRLGAMMAVIGI